METQGAVGGEVKGDNAGCGPSVEKPGGKGTAVRGDTSPGALFWCSDWRIIAPGSGLLSPARGNDYGARRPLGFAGAAASSTAIAAARTALAAAPRSGSIRAATAAPS